MTLLERLAQAKQRPVPADKPEWVKRRDAGKLPARVDYGRAA